MTRRLGLALRELMAGLDRPIPEGICAGCGRRPIERRGALCSSCRQKIPKRLQQGKPIAARKGKP